MRASISAVICLCFASAFSRNAFADDAIDPSAQVPGQRQRPTAWDRFFATPFFVSPGFLTTFANPEARGTFGAEISAVHWFKSTLDSPGLGVYGQGEYVNGGNLRGSIGAQANWSIVGIETGYAYESAFEGSRYVHAVQITPFLSEGVIYFGVRSLMTFSGRPPAFAAVFGVKAPINLGRDVDVTGPNRGPLSPGML